MSVSEGRCSIANVEIYVREIRGKQTPFRDADLIFRQRSNEVFKYALVCILIVIKGFSFGCSSLLNGFQVRAPCIWLFDFRSHLKATRDSKSYQGSSNHSKSPASTLDCSKLFSNLKKSLLLAGPQVYPSVCSIPSSFTIYVLKFEYTAATISLSSAHH
jgi:hypothetical protein